MLWKKTIVMMSLAICSLSLLAAKNDQVFSEEKTNIMITAKQPLFTIKLKSNPTTGYAWYLREYDYQFLTPLKHQFESPKNKKANRLIGEPGYELWTFRVKPAGFIVPQQTLIRFVYARPWQSTEGTTQLVFRVTTGNAGANVTH